MTLSAKIYSKTGKGSRALSSKSRQLSSNALKILSCIDSKTDTVKILAQLEKLTEDEFSALASQLETDGYIRLLNKTEWDFGDTNFDYRTGVVVDELSVEDFLAMATEPESSAGDKVTEVEVVSAKTVNKEPSADELAEMEARLNALRQAQDEEEARAIAEKIAMREAERQARELEGQAKAEALALEKAEESAKLEAERKAMDEEEARRQAEEAARLRAEEEARQEQQRLAREIERKAREAAARLKVEADIRAQAEKAARQEAERIAREEAKRKEREEKAARRKTVTEARARAEVAARFEAERKAQEAAERKAMEEEEARRQAEEAARLRVEEEARQEAERLVREEAERKACEAETARVKAEAEARAWAEEAERKARKEENACQKVEAAARAKEETRRKVQEKKESRRAAATEARVRAEEEARYQAELKAREKAERSAEKEAPRSTKNPGKWLVMLVKPLLVYLPLALVVLVGLLHFVNLAVLAGPVEKLASDTIGEPVTIRKMYVALFPYPRLTLSSIRVGADKEIEVGSIHISPTAAMLFDDVKTIESLEIEQLVVDSASLGRQMQWISTSARSAHLKIGQIALKNISFNIPGLELTPFDGSVELLPSGGFGMIELNSTDQNLALQFMPQVGNYRVTVEASNWQPAGTQLRFSKFSADGVADENQVRFNQIEGELYGGSMKAVGVVEWSTQPIASGNFELEKIRLPLALSAIKSSASVDGSLNASASFLSKASEVGALVEAAEINASFVVLDGKINGVDLASRMVASSSGDNSTRFDKLTGKLQLNQGIYQYRQLELDAAQFHARGNLDIQPNQDTTGKVSAELSVAARRIRSKLNLGGKVGAVQIY